MREHQKMSDEERKSAIEHVLDFMRFLSEKGIQGNVSVPFYDGGPGKVKVELWFDPVSAKKKLIGFAKPLPINPGMGEKG